MKKTIGAALVLCILFSCAGPKKTTRTSLPALRFLGEYLLPADTHFGGTRVGGLSGIDYSPKEDLYYIISDDRSDHNPARFYTAMISVSEKGIGNLQWTGTKPLLQPNGAVFPNKVQDSLRVPDPEAVRQNQRTGDLVWSSEGERIVRKGAAVLQNPAIHIMDKSGLWKDSFRLPANLYVRATEKGPRRNGVLEGLAFADGFKTLYASVEEPLYEDGQRATAQRGGWIRIVKYNVATKTPAAQYAYPIDPVARPPVPPDSFSINGVVDILALDDGRLLVTERSWSYGHVGCDVKVYAVDVNDADDVAGVPSLQAAPPQRFLRKRLLLDMKTLGCEVYNIEGATLGPRLPNGKQSLLFIADDNFSGREKTQLLLFELQ